MRIRSLKRTARRAANTLTPWGWEVVGSTIAAAALTWAAFATAVPQ